MEWGCLLKISCIAGLIWSPDPINRAVQRSSIDGSRSPCANLPENFASKCTSYECNPVTGMMKEYPCNDKREFCDEVLKYEIYDEDAPFPDCCSIAVCRGQVSRRFKERYGEEYARPYFPMSERK